MNQKKIDQIIEKILHCNEFQGSDSYCRLLKYLVEKSLEGNPPKESAIAMDIFGKDAGSDKIDSSSVRVYMHNLRQKLNSYYLNEGKEDDIRLNIPKGHYQVIFESFSKDKRKDSYKILILTNSISLTLIVVFIVAYLLNSNPLATDSKVSSHIWNEYINDNKPVLLVFGDYYLYEDSTLNRLRYIRDFKVNSKEDFQEHIASDSELAAIFRESNHTLLGKFALNCLHDLFVFFSRYDKEINVLLGSNLQWEDLNRSNIIFIGSFKTLRLLKNLIKNHHFKYKVNPNTLIFKDTQQDTSYSYQSPKDHTTGQVKDYAIFSRFPGPNNNVITLFSSTHDVGHISTVRYFTNWESISAFEKTNKATGNNAYFFDAVFEVQGFARIGFKPELIHFSWIIEE